MLRETIGLPRLELRLLLVRQLLFGAQVIHALLRLVDGRPVALHLVLELQHARLEDLDGLHALLHGGRLDLLRLRANGGSVSECRQCVR